MNNKGNLTDERPPLLPVIIGTGFGSGFWPWGPGTAGSVLATLIWAALAYGLGITGESLQSITFFLVIVFTILGTWATAQLQPYWGEDPSRVVIDEMAGVWIPLSLLTPLTAQGEVKDAWWWACGEHQCGMILFSAPQQLHVRWQNCPVHIVSIC